jgi:putative copper export protein
MNALFATVRAVHYASAMLLFGELVFAFAVAGRAGSGGGAVGSLDPGEIRRRFLRVAIASVVAGIASGVAWLALAAVSMSGLPVADALDRATLGLVLSSTTFGNAWLVRGGLAVALCALLFALAKSPPRGTAFAGMLAMLLIAAAYLGALIVDQHEATVRRRRRDRRGCHPPLAAGVRARCPRSCSCFAASRRSRRPLGRHGIFRRWGRCAFRCWWRAAP